MYCYDGKQSEGPYGIGNTQRTAITARDGDAFAFEDGSGVVDGINVEKALVVFLLGAGEPRLLIGDAVFFGRHAGGCGCCCCG